MPSIIPISPTWKLDLKHGAARLASTPGAERIAIAAEDSVISVIDRGQSSVQKIKVSEPAGHLAINSTGDSLAVVGASHNLQILSLDSAKFGREIVRLGTQVPDACEFSRDDNFLWTVGLLPDDDGEILCYDTRSWQIVGRHRFTPLIGGCGFMLTVHPREDVLGLWACGGPDEVWNYSLRLTAPGIEFQHQPELDGLTPLCFNTRGDRFVGLRGCDLESFSFPSCESLYPPMSGTDVDENEDDRFAESMCFLDSSADDRVLAATTEGRCLVVALERGEVIAEAVLEGHEPKPCYQVYTSLSKKIDDRLCSDLHGFTPVGSNSILSVHTNGRASNRQDTLLLWKYAG